MKTLRVNQKQFAQVLQLIKKHRADWPAVFSTNPKQEVWLFTTYGWTRPEHRRRRRLGGRFFISDNGAFLKRDKEDEKFVAFDFSEPPRPAVVRPVVRTARPIIQARITPKGR
jgi:hypothetical protein